MRKIECTERGKFFVYSIDDNVTNTNAGC